MSRGSSAQASAMAASPDRSATVNVRRARLEACTSDGQHEQQQRQDMGADDDPSVAVVEGVHLLQAPQPAKESADAVQRKVALVVGGRIALKGEGGIEGEGALVFRSLRKSS
jgi:hypothetical protein